MYPENPEGTQVIVGSMNMGYISHTARNRTHNLFRSKREPIPLGHSDGLCLTMYIQIIFNVCISHACITYNKTHSRNPILAYLTNNDQYLITISNEKSIFAPTR